MAHTPFGCPHQTVPLRSVQLSVRKFATRQQLASAICNSLHQSGCPEQKSAKQRSSRRARVVPSQLLTSRPESHQRSLACCAHNHSGVFDSGLNASSQTPAEDSQVCTSRYCAYELRLYIDIARSLFIMSTGMPIVSTPQHFSRCGFCRVQQIQKYHGVSKSSSL